MREKQSGRSSTAPRLAAEIQLNSLLRVNDVCGLLCPPFARFRVYRRLRHNKTLVSSKHGGAR